MSALKKMKYYSAASFCFGSNIRLYQVFLESKNFSEKKYEGLFEELKKEILKYEETIDKTEIKTISDLESYMVVKERLLEALDYTEKKDNNSLEYSYAYANERLRSAHSWAEFLNHKGEQFKFDKERLKEICRQKIAESEERLQYASIYIPFGLESPKTELSRAYDDFNSGNYELCIFKASKSKAESNVILSSIGVNEDYLKEYIENKLKIAGRVISKAAEKNRFPILGYSYYQYAISLKDDPYSALLYTEYALELSNLDLYFEKRELFIIPKIEMEKMHLLIIGILIGMLAGILISNYKPSKTRALLGKKR